MFILQSFNLLMVLIHTGPAAIADAIRDNGALIKLDISMNDIKAEQEGDLQRICVASGVELVI
jgi:hypothetical protein